MRAVAFFLAVVLASVEARFPQLQGAACNKLNDECWPCNIPSGQQPEVPCGCTSGECSCTLANRTACDTVPYSPGNRTLWTCQLPPVKTRASGQTCSRDQECKTGKCLADLSGSTAGAVVASTCGSVSLIGDKCNTDRECRGVSEYTFSMCLPNAAGVKVCQGGVKGDPCCIGDEYNKIETSVAQKSKSCDLYPLGHTHAGKRQMGCGPKLFCNTTGTGAGKSGVCVDQLGNPNQARPCISTIADISQCGYQQICSNYNYIESSFYTAAGAKVYGPDLPVIDQAAYDARTGTVGLKNPSVGVCVKAASLNQSQACGTAKGSSVLCSTVDSGDLACVGGLCRFVSDSTACANSAECGFYGSCGCSTNGVSSNGGLCNGLAVVPACRAELELLRGCALNQTNCPTIEIEGATAWLDDGLMMSDSATNKSCFSACRDRYRNFACCRGQKERCIREPEDVAGLVTGVFAFAIGVAVSVVILLEIPQDYLGPVWLSLCWWHMWPEDIIDFIDSRPLMFPRKGLNGQDVNANTKRIFAPTKSDKAASACSCSSC